MNDLVEKQPAEIKCSDNPVTPQNMAVTPQAMLQMAVAQGADLDKLDKLMELQERWEANEARKAYLSAMNEFNKGAPKITKDKHVSFGNTQYNHASLENVVEKIIEALAKHGL